MTISTKKIRTTFSKPKTKMSVSYLAGQFIDAEGIISQKFTWTWVSRGYVKRYFNHMQITSKLRPRTRLLLDFITEKMDKFNAIQNSKILQNNFITLLEKSCGIKPKSKSFIHKGFQELKKSGILLYDDSPEMKGIYIVNPKYYYRGSDKSRKVLITNLSSKLWKMKNDNNYNHLIDKK
ncbi:MAG: hypothetical protein HY841_14460 [Bacteroidetes bacterium]|nr:hypothetical protein [Bacteroidota bacterium]